MATFDFVIIGSGLGGLASGYILAKEGFSVCILEKNRQFGGNLQTFARDKCVFDTGVHYLGGLDEGQNLYRYFDYLGLMGKLKLRRMDENGFDRITFAGGPIEYPHAMGYDNFSRRLTELFPGSKNEIKNYCNTLQEVCNSFPLYRVQDKEHIIPIQYLTANAHDFLHDTISDPKLRDVLAGSIMLYGGSRNKSSLYQHALTINSYIESAWKCVDGGSQITKILVKNIRDMGGVLMNYTEVTQLHIPDKEITYAELDNGERIYGKTFISNIHPAETMQLTEAGKVKESYRKRLLELENSISVFSVHLVFHPDTFPYLNHNYYHHEPHDLWESVHYQKEHWPYNFMAITPATSRSEQWAESMTIMAYMKAEETARWADTFSIIPQHENDRGADYQEFKAEKAEKIISILDQRLFPGIRRKIRSVHTSSPLSYRDYIATPGGSMYGVVKDHNNPLGTMLSHKTKVPNLFLTGQNLNTHGILGVTVSAVKTCGEFVGQGYLLRKIGKK